VLYGKQTDENGNPQGVDEPSKYYIKYTFGRDNEASPWILSAVDSSHNGQELSPEELVALEKSTKRDFNGDSAIGLKIDSTFNSDAGSMTVTGEAKKVFRAQVDELSFYLIGNGLLTGTVIKPLGLPSGVGLLKDADEKAWTPGDGKEIASFKKLTAAEATAAANDEGVTDAAYKATLDDDSIVYFDNSLKVVSA